MDKENKLIENNNTYYFSDDKVNEYIIELNNDSNYIISPVGNIGFCISCGKEITEGRFCDFECKRNYYAEINHDLGGFED